MNSLDNIVQFYGGHIQDGRYYTVLEYADSGTLEDFFQQFDKRPGSAEEILDFWNEIFGIARALHLLHQIQPEELQNTQKILG